MLKFKDTWALVTGASSGIGRALAFELAARGTHLVVTARSEDKLRALAEELTRRHGVQVHVLPADLEQPGGAAELAARVEALGVTLDHVVNNAGFGAAHRFVDMPLSEMLAMVRLNCEALTVLTRHFLPQLVQRGSGGVLQVASMIAFFPVPFMAEYGASKAYVLSLSRALREEIRGSGVQLSVLCPGPVPSGFQARAGYSLTSAESGSALTPEKVAAITVRDYGRGRFVIAPGLSNRLGALFIHLVPAWLIARATAFFMRAVGRA
jgi:short-subunit dehydrogenase